MATMEIVAKRTGGSVAKVSHLINETWFVGEELPQRVLRAMENGMPVVVADRKMPEAQVDSVLVDSFQGGYEATKDFLDLAIGGSGVSAARGI